VNVVAVIITTTDPGVFHCLLSVEANSPRRVGSERLQLRDRLRFGPGSVPVRGKQDASVRKAAQSRLPGWNRLSSDDDCRFWLVLTAAFEELFGSFVNCAGNQVTPILVLLSW